MQPPPLTPAQERTLALLRRSGEPVEFAPDFVDDLRERMQDACERAGERLGERQLFVNKHVVSSVLECEVHHLQPDDFRWTPARARGQVSHKAIQLLVHWRGEPTPMALVDDAIARLVDDVRDFGRWVGGLTDADLADLRGQAVDQVTKFVESFPPLDPRSHPVTEAAAQWPVDASVLLRARADLVLGRPIGRESRKLIIDLKSGRSSDRHRHDLRFYALVETLVRDVPPRRLATFYLDAARPVIEDVTEAVLESALRRALAAIDRLIQLEVEGATPRKRPGAPCNWCPVQAGCDEGRAYLDATAAGEHVDP